MITIIRPRSASSGVGNKVSLGAFGGQIGIGFAQVDVIYIGQSGRPTQLYWFDSGEWQC